MNNWKNNQYICTMIKDVVFSIKNGKSFNLQGILEVFNTIRDVDMQVKLLSILAAYLMLNDPNIEAVITFNPLYDQVCKILGNCPQKKTTILFNFLSALLYVNDEDSPKRKSMVVYARNMMRSSGCLASLCDLFTSSMMNQDAWRALCRCLAETCRGIEANQSYCTHLVPLCVQKCSQRNIEVLLVLQSLLQNHCRNISLFVECNGIALFQRDFLQLDVYLQLLATVAQSSPGAALIASTDICDQMQDFLRLYGPQSKLGQWATIILHHTSKIEACGDTNTKPVKETNEPMKSLHGTRVLEEQNYDADCSTDTARLLKNVIREIYQNGAQKDFKGAQEIFPIKMNAESQINNNQITRNLSYNTTGPNNRPTSARVVSKPSQVVKNTRVIKNNTLHSSQAKELSFSFLRNHNFPKPQANVRLNTADKIYRSFQSTQSAFKNNLKNDSIYQSSILIQGSHNNTTETIAFNPYFASTPKKESFEESRQSTIYRKQKLRCQLKKRRENKKRLERSSVVTEIKHRSISGRFFDVINESCTTLVKTVKNIFRPKSNKDETKEHSVANTSKRHASTCNYSFTNYMRKRDAILLNECSHKSEDESVDSDSGDDENVEDFSVAMSNSCNTCNNTISLKRKLEKDQHLKKTIRKLKLGINLYGCDFKKISRAMWPQESYMTPAVLYNLYRKLIIK
ncbi:unnamed protein product [Chrysodeixis includens]|uniref:Uncharacterized protein n=1 Tax=Chrysodeixis includens TaxID=689277 RepID=A0A9P0FVB4_CHRIL|nr:unnamed protein product [Chrysodeixis includens]